MTDYTPVAVAPEDSSFCSSVNTLKKVEKTRITHSAVQKPMRKKLKKLYKIALAETRNHPIGPKPTRRPIELAYLQNMGQESRIFTTIKEAITTATNTELPSWKKYPFKTNSLYGTVFQPLKIIGKGSFGSVCSCKISQYFRLFEIRKYFCPLLCDSLLEWPEDYKQTNYQNKWQSIVAIKMLANEEPVLKPEHFYSDPEVDFILNVPAHPNLLEVYDISVDENTKHIYIVTEQMQTSLGQLIRKRQGKCERLLPLKVYKSIMAQILSGLEHIHKHGYYHRDLKPDNILLTKTKDYYSAAYLSLHPELLEHYYVVKICDYGLSRRGSTKDINKTSLGTLIYMSPEMVFMGNYDDKTDVWSLGVLAYELLTLEDLFPTQEMAKNDHLKNIIKILGSPAPCHENNNNSNNESYYGYWETAALELQNRGLEFVNQKGLPLVQTTPADSKQRGRKYQHFWELIRWCLQWDPNNRLSAEQLKQFIK